MLHAFALAFRQLGDRRLVGVVAKSLAITLILFLAAGFGLFRLLDTLLPGGLGADGRGTVAALLTLILGLGLFWLAFRAVAIAVVGLFGDQVVAAVERRSYPAALAAARPVPFRRSLAMGAGSVGRLILYNGLAIPLYLVTLATGVGLPIAFFAINGWLLGRDLGDMVAARHLDSSELRRWRARTHWPRFVAGLAAGGLFVVPGLNLLAPVVGAAAMTHLFHRGRRV